MDPCRRPLLFNALTHSQSFIGQWYGPALILPRQRLKLARGANNEEHVMPQLISARVAVVGIDIGRSTPLVRTAAERPHVSKHAFQIKFSLPLPTPQTLPGPIMPGPTAANSTSREFLKA